MPSAHTHWHQTYGCCSDPFYSDPTKFYWWMLLSIKKCDFYMQHAFKGEFTNHHKLRSKNFDGFSSNQFRFGQNLATAKMKFNIMKHSQKKDSCKNCFKHQSTCTVCLIIENHLDWIHLILHWFQSKIAFLLFIDISFFFNTCELRTFSIKSIN